MEVNELLALERKACITKTIEWFFMQLNQGDMECGDIEKFVANYKKYMEEMIMTREDAKRILACRGNGYSEEDFNNAIEVAFNSIPSLLFDINEAAKEYLISVDAYKNTDYGCKFDQFDIETFKAGAEWLAGQGETLYDTINVDGKNQRWLGENLLYGDYNAGQAVIVQIRKV